MTALRLTSAIIVLLLAGFGVTTLASRRPARLDVIECVCLSWLFGTGAVSLLLWIIGGVLRGPALFATVAAICLALGICGWRRARSRGITWSWPAISGAGSWLVVAILTIEIALAFFVSGKNSLGWDGSFNWESKARYAFLAGGAIPSPYYANDSQVLAHPEYPLLIPFTELWFYLFLGEANQFWVKLIFPTFYAVGVVLLTILGTRLSGRFWAGGIAAALLFFIPWLVRQPGGIASGYVDVPLSMIYLAAIGYLLLFQIRGDPNFARISAIALTLLPWAKLEGAILWLAGAVLTVAICWRKKRQWLGFAYVLPGGIVIVVWQIFLHAMSVKPPHDFMAMTPANLWANIGRVPAIAGMLVVELSRTNDWSFFWLLVTVAVLYQSFRARDARLFVLGAAIILPVAAYASTYIFSAWPDFRGHMEYSLVRLLIHVTPIGCALVAIALPAGPNDQSSPPIERSEAPAI